MFKVGQLLRFVAPSVAYSSEDVMCGYVGHNHAFCIYLGVRAFTVHEWCTVLTHKGVVEVRIISLEPVDE